MASEADRPRVVAEHRVWLWGQVQTDTPVRRALLSIPPGSVLGCFCAPKACHCDTLASAWEWLDESGAMKVRLGSTSYYGIKDQEKSDRASCFIGRGSPASSTRKYMLAWGLLANKGSYSPEDVVFISAEGARGGRLDPDLVEISLACKAGASMVTDTLHDRTRAYNVGERQVANFLLSQGYVETEPGFWTPGKEEA